MEQNNNDNRKPESVNIQPPDVAATPIAGANYCNLYYDSYVRIYHSFQCGISYTYNIKYNYMSGLSTKHDDSIQQIYGDFDLDFG